MREIDTAVLDWGIGGLSVWNAVKRREPERTMLYLSDAGTTPYGKLPRAALAARVLAIARRLAGEGIGRLAVACNAASTVLPELAGELSRLGIAVTGVIEHGIALADESGYRTVGILGGRRTVLSQSYARALRQAGCTVRGRIAQPLSALIESGELESAEMTALLRHLLKPLRGAEAVVLACTHYPAVQGQIQALLPGTVLLDPAEAMADHIRRAWPPLHAGGEDLFFTTGDPAAMRRSAEKAFGNRLRQIQRFSSPPTSAPLEPCPRSSARTRPPS